MVSIYILVFVTLVTACASVPVEPQGTRVGCVKCNPIETKRFNVHLVPHSHDDVGWLKTVHQYYYGERNDIQVASVKNIIDSMIDSLAKNPERRFIQVESAFFWQWWTTQTDESRRQLFRRLVESGQLEMVNGAWSMNDEACVNYQSTIDQYTWGLRIINETVGECGTPTVGWQIDPFGHSREHASLLSQMGYDGVFFARLHNVDKETRQSRGALDLAWQGSVNLDNSIIFTGIFPTGSYYPPEGHCYDTHCSDRIDDNKGSAWYNLDSKIANLKEHVKTWAEYYPTNNILITMGGDFHYQKAETNFENMDKLIKGMKDDPDYNVFYSTPSCYIQAVHNSNPTLELQTEDFFPYSENEHTYWTGYFTSRPNSKRFERMGHSILQATKQVTALATTLSGKSYEEDLRKLREVMGVMQHHDAITGTEKQHVADDYVKLLTDAIRKAEEPMGEAIMELLSKGTSDDIITELSSCLLANVSICTVSQDADKFLVVAYNPLSWTTTHYVRLPVEDASYLINGPDGVEKYDLVPSITNAFDPIVPDQKSSQFDLVFAANNLPPMGIKLYHITRSPKTNSESSDDKFQDIPFTVDPETNLLNSVTLNGVTLDVTQNFYFYEANPYYPASGAYLFRPLENKPEELTNVEKITEFKGKIVHEFHQKWKTGELDLAQVIRWYKNENYLEFDWVVGYLDKTSRGKEVITRFNFDNFDNEGVFYTDSNGRERITRTKDKNPGFEDNHQNEPVSSNYYPVTSQIAIRDEQKDLEVVLLNDRAQGGSSLANGQVELMIHRRLTRDDGKGVDENLDEHEYGKGNYVRGSHYLVFGKASTGNPNGKSVAAQARIMAQKNLLHPWLGLSQTDLSFDEVESAINTKYTALTGPLPENVNILTLEPWGSKSLILRVEHIMEKTDDSKLSEPVEIDLKDTLDAFNINKITEMTLAANQKLADRITKGYTWNLKVDKEETVRTSGDTSETTITLSPMKIRTFVIEFGTVEQGGNPKLDSVKKTGGSAKQIDHPTQEQHFRVVRQVHLPDNLKDKMTSSSNLTRDACFVLLAGLGVAVTFIWSFKW